MRTKLVVVAIILCSFTAVSSFAQSLPPLSGAPPPPPSKTPTQALRVNARMVQVNVVVRDKQGVPVSGLKKSDFTILDQNKPQEISSFTQQNNQATVITAASRGQNVFSNKFVEGSGRASIATVILLDAINTSRQDFALAEEQVVRFVEEMKPEDRVALYSITLSKFIVHHDFTSDKDALLRALADARSKAGAENFGLLPLVGSNSVPSYAVSRLEQTTDALKFIAGRLSKIPGRKNLIWVTSGFPYRMNGRTGMELSDSAKVLNNANVAVYPVDARGLVAPVGGNPLPLGDVDVDAMMVLAQDTGGRTFFNTNDISTSIQSAVDDSHVTYVLTYYPSHDQWNGKYRQIKVKVDRPGVELRYRNGYFAFPEGSKATQPRQQLIADALHSPLEMIDLGFDVHADISKTTGDSQLSVQIHIDPGQLKFQQQGDRWTDSLEIMWVELDADGKIVGHGAHTLSLKPVAQGYDEILHQGLTFSEHAKVMNGAVEVRLVIADNGSDVIGSVTVSVAQLLNKIKPEII
jgi:VWFA-related protein